MKNYDEQTLREEYTPKKQTGLDEAKRLEKRLNYQFIFLAIVLE